MKRKLRIIGVSIALAAMMLGCGTSASDDEAVASSQSAIWGGQAINDGSNPVSKKFYISTVGLFTPTPGTDPPTGAACTGVIVASNMILTAAHCTPNNTTTVYLYGPTGSASTGGATVVDYRLATQCDPDHAGLSSCISNGTYSDLALLKLSAPISAPLHSVPMGASGQFGSSPQASFWEAGVGTTNLPNSVAWQMRWGPANPILNDSTGTVVTRSLRGLPGDSGGPLYQADGADADGAPNLILTGILSTYQYEDGNPLLVAGGGTNTFSSVQYPANYTWIHDTMTALGAATPIRPPVVGTHSTLPFEGEPGPGAQDGFGRLIPVSER